MEELAGASMTARADDDASVASLIAGLTMLEGVGDALPEAVQQKIGHLRQRLEALGSAPGADPQADLDEVRRDIAALQEEIARGGDDERERAATQGQFVLPEWVEESVFLEFAAASQAALDDIEADMLALERGQERPALRGRIHTLKGEAGVLGLEALEHVCHALEDYLDRDAWSVDALLAVKDWIGEAIQSYTRREIPSPDAILSTLRGVGSEPTCVAPDPSDAVPDAVSEPAMSTSADDSIEASSEASEPVWDEDTLEIVGEFLQESDEGLTQVDEILLRAEQEPMDDEQINALFRVFHTIKGVSGFLELEQITKLAHTTETMLDQGRKGDLLIEGAVLDLVFDATEMTRRMLADLRAAVGAGTRPGSEPDLEILTSKLESLIHGQRLREEDLPPAKPGDRLGEILSRAPVSVSPQAVEAGLKSQHASGRRLGEELVAQKQAKPKQVAQALRAQGRAETQTAKLKEVVKIDLERVDNLVALIGELVIAEAMVVNAPELSGLTNPWLRKQLGQMSKITRDLQDIGTRMRMVPVRGVFQKMARMVRDLSRRSDKSISVRMSGESTEIDRSMVEQIGDPLVHMIRNAVDHGIETKEQRLESDKPPRGMIELRAYHQGGSVVIEVADDGRGLDRDAILHKAMERGIVKDGEKLTDAEIYNLIFAPGFSTAKQVTEISGRGVGMDVVRRNIEAIRGRVKIDSTPGQGSSFTMVLPLTLAIIDGMLVACGPERYIIPTLSVLESIRPDPSMVFSVTGRGEIISLRGETFPLFRLGRLLGIDEAVRDATSALVVVVESRGKKIGLLVDDVLNQQQVVIKSLGDGLSTARYLSGAAIMSDGCVGLIINTEEIGSLVDRSTFRIRHDAEAHRGADDDWAPAPTDATTTGEPHRTGEASV